MTSRPLFISVAESTLIFGPIDQLGCFSASSGLAAAIASRVQPRNGPPDAVRMILSTSAIGRPSSAWKMALCSESTGRTLTPARRASPMKISPAQTRHSLLASAMRRAGADGGERRREPGRADDRGDDDVDRPRGRLLDRRGAGGRLDAGAGKRILERAIGRPVGDHRKPRFARARRGRGSRHCRTPSPPRPQTPPGARR